jgi:exodeoxyribonuclease V alpha subunit
VRITATVTISTVHPGPSGGAIFSGHDTTGTHLRFVANRDRIFRVPLVGEVWSLQGASRSHPRYGDQVHVVRASLVEPAGRLIVDFLLKHPAFDGLGIGKAKAARLWAEFGPTLHLALSKGDVGKLSDVLPGDSAQKLVDAWRSVTDEASVVSFLDQHGFDLRLANKVRRVWPVNTLAKLIDNPYRMLAFADWEKVDRAARSLGVTQHDPRRQVAAVEACLYRRLDAKHTLTPQAMLLDGVRGLMQTRSLEVASAAVEQALSEQAIVVTADGYQPLGAAVMEKVVANRLREMSGGAPGPERNLFSANLAAIMAEAIASFEKSVGLKLNAGPAKGGRDGRPSAAQRTYRRSGNRKDNGTSGDSSHCRTSRSSGASDGAQRPRGPTDARGDVATGIDHCRFPTDGRAKESRS